MPENPYRHNWFIPSRREKFPPTPNPDLEQGYGSEDTISRWKAFKKDPIGSIMKALFVYSLVLLPTLYFSRVQIIFKYAQLTKEGLMAAQDTATLVNHGGCDHGTHVGTTALSSFSNLDDAERLPVLRFRTSWESFIDNLSREWKTFNIVSGLLIS